jgi:hypothetical protein
MESRRHKGLPGTFVVHKKETSLESDAPERPANLALALAL